MKIMKKAVLLLLIPLLLTACGQKESDRSGYSETLGGWTIYTADGLELLRQHPEDTFYIMDDIDCGGRDWTPVEAFSGKLSGVWGGNFNHTVFNLNILPGAENTGLFGTVTGSVSCLNFDNITVTLPEDFSGNAGFLAGTSTGEISKISATNICITANGAKGNIGGFAGDLKKGAESCSLSGLMQGSASGNIGGFAGSADSIITSCKSRVTVDMEVHGNVGGFAGTLAGLCSKVDFSGAFSVTGTGNISPLAGILSGKLENSCSSATQALVNGFAPDNAFYGTCDGGTLDDCWVRDPSNLVILSPEELAMRQLTERKMYEICTVHWIPSVDMDYTDRGSGPKLQHFVAGQDYFGMPYTHYCGSLERFRYYQNPDGTLVEGIRSTGWERLLGNDCADALYWAWSTVSASITYTLTDNMICCNGTVPVGNYRLADNLSTERTCALNGDQAMYEAYTRLQTGDAVLTAPGHVRMVAEPAFVYRNEDGTVNPDKSYVLCHEQGANYSDLASYRSTCRVNKKVTFSKLFSGNYIPITIPEFAQGQPSIPEVTCDDRDNIEKGTVHTNYRMNWITVNVLDSSGQTVLTRTAYPSTGSHNNSYDLSLMNLSSSIRELKPGQYCYQVLVGIGTQELEIKSVSFEN